VHFLEANKLFEKLSYSVLSFKIKTKYSIEYLSLDVECGLTDKNYGSDNKSYNL
jgi:hypothetical protein